MNPFVAKLFRSHTLTQTTFQILLILNHESRTAIKAFIIICVHLCLSVGRFLVSYGRPEALYERGTRNPQM